MLCHKNANCEQKLKCSKFMKKERQDSWCALLLNFLQFITNVSCISDDELLWTAIMVWMSAVFWFEIHNTVTTKWFLIYVSGLIFSCEITWRWEVFLKFVEDSYLQEHLLYILPFDFFTISSIDVSGSFVSCLCRCLDMSISCHHCSWQFFQHWAQGLYSLTNLMVYCCF